MKNCRGFLAALVAAITFFAATATARTVTVPVVPSEPDPASIVRIEYALGVWEIKNPKTLKAVEAMAADVATRIKKGENLCVAIQGTADIVPFPNGDLVVRRLGAVSQIFARAGVTTNRMRVEPPLTETPIGERYVRVWLYPDGFASVTLDVPDVEAIENRLSAVERRLDAGEAGLAVARDEIASAREEAWRAWEAVDRVVDVAAGVGGTYQSEPGAFGPEATVEVRFAPDPGLPLALVANGGLGFLDGQANWTVGGGIGAWGDRVGGSVRYARTLYAPYRHAEADGGLAQAYRVDVHGVAVSVDTRLVAQLWLRLEGNVGAAHWGDPTTEPTSGTVGGGSVALMYKFF